MTDHDKMYQMFMQTERHKIHSAPHEVFRALNFTAEDTGYFFMSVLEGPPNGFEARMRDALDELVVKYVHHLIDVELGVD